MFYRRLFNVPTARYGGMYDELERMRMEMDRLFTGMRTFPFQRDLAGVFPLINLNEDKEKYYIRAELPGVASEELDIQATGSGISISGERKIASEANGVKYHRKERDAGKFSRVINLPGDIDLDKVEADLKNGILTVTVPKAEKAKPKQIAIKS